jgi:succinate dehydrogenase/fumarate reductase flavoprotein subunit
MNINQPNYDLLIIGIGTAGMPCAIAAAEKGAKVLAIEKDKVGGTLHLTAGHMSGGGFRRQVADFKIQDSPQTHYDDVMRVSFDTAESHIVKLATQEAPKMIDWLDEQGFDFVEDTPRFVYGHVPYETPRTVWGKQAGLSIFNILNPHYQKYEQNGNITTLTGHKLIDLIVEETPQNKDNKNIIGVVVEEVNSGKICQFYAKNTVITTGGYASNPSLFARFHPWMSRLISTASPNSQGEGITIAEQYGARIWGKEKHLSSLGGLELKQGTGRADYWTAWAILFTSKYRMPKEIYVNDNGDRFLNEEILSPDDRERIITQQPNHRFWVVMDEKGLTESESLIRDWSYDKMKSEAENNNFIFKANSIEELAQKTGLALENLQKSIQNYNEAVDGKTTDPMGREVLTHGIKTAPFYCFLSYLTSLISFAGIAVDEDLQVIDEQGNKIGGLYAAGEAIGAGATSGNAFCGGMLVTPALSLGRYLGEKLG